MHWRATLIIAFNGSPVNGLTHDRRGWPIIFRWRPDRQLGRPAWVNRPCRRGDLGSQRGEEPVRISQLRKEFGAGAEDAGGADGMNAKRAKEQPKGLNTKLRSKIIQGFE